ncbi:MAG: hypothetical protein V9E93_20155 [Steroidobacteraceae bacterium]
MSNLILKILKYALYLGITGTLIEETFDLRERAFDASKRGIISLRAINKVLLGNPK